jgi:hypothetical protein
MTKVKVYFTVDVEIWPGAWDGLDSRFPEAFRRYIYGDTPQGQYGLPMTLRVLSEHGLRGVFYVEPLFSFRFGLAPLQEVVGLVREAGHEVQLHLHTEWVDEITEPLLPLRPQRKMQHLCYFSREDQQRLIGHGKRRLIQAGADAPNAFRAGSFRFDAKTLDALGSNDIHIDSSYNHCSDGPRSGIVPSLKVVPVLPFRVGEMLEHPVTVFSTPAGLRPLQLTACSFAEMERVLWGAAERGDSSVVVVSHNFELLDRRDFSRDAVVVRRFEGLCRFLRQNTDTFDCGTYSDSEPPFAVGSQPPPLRSGWSGWMVRTLEQVRRRM